MGAVVSSMAGSGKVMDMKKKGLTFQLLQQHLNVTEAATLLKITHLLLCRNKLSALPPEITTLVSLTELAATDNWMKKVPHEVMALTALRELRLGGNRLVGFQELVPEYRPGFVLPKKGGKPARAIMTASSAATSQKGGSAARGARTPPASASTYDPDDEVQRVRVRL